MPRLMVGLALFVLGCGAVDLSPAASALHQLRAPPSNCRKIGTANGHSGVNGWLFDAKGRAIAEALENAANMPGATDIVWEHLDERWTGGTAVCEVYVCERNK